MNLVWTLWVPLMSSAVCGSLGVLALWGSHQAMVQVGRVARDDAGAAAGPLDGVKRLIGQTPVGRALRLRLDQVGLTWHEADVLGLVIVAAFVAFYAARGFLALHTFGATVVAVVATGLGIRSLWAARREWHNRRFVEQLPEVTWVFANALRAGMSIQQALALVAREVPKPARHFFQRLVDEIELARPVEAVLQDSTRLVPSQEYGLMVTITLIQYRAGGDLAGAMEDLSHTLMERKSVNEEVQSATSGARMTAVILPFMPLFCAGVLNMAIPGALNVLFTGWGIALLVVFLFLQWAAYTAIRRLAEIKV